MSGVFTASTYKNRTSFLADVLIVAGGGGAGFSPSTSINAGGCGGGGGVFKTSEITFRSGGTYSITIGGGGVGGVNGVAASNGNNTTIVGSGTETYTWTTYGGGAGMWGASSGTGSSGGNGGGGTSYVGASKAGGIAISSNITTGGTTVAMSTVYGMVPAIPSNPPKATFTSTIVGNQITILILTGTITRGMVLSGGAVTAGTYINGGGWNGASNGTGTGSSGTYTLNQSATGTPTDGTPIMPYYYVIGTKGSAGDPTYGNGNGGGAGGMARYGDGDYIGLDSNIANGMWIGAFSNPTIVNAYFSPGGLGNTVTEKSYGAGGGTSVNANSVTLPRDGYAGNQGCVVIRYLSGLPPPVSTTGTFLLYPDSGGYRIYVFTTSGSLTF